MSTHSLEEREQYNLCLVMFLCVSVRQTKILRNFSAADELNDKRVKELERRRKTTCECKHLGLIYL